MSFPWQELVWLLIGLAVGLVLGMLLGRWLQKNAEQPPRPTAAPTLAPSPSDSWSRMLDLRVEEMLRMLKAIEGQVERLRSMLDERLPEACDRTGNRAGDVADAPGAEVAGPVSPRINPQASDSPAEGDDLRAVALEAYRPLVADPSGEGFQKLLERFDGVLVGAEGENHFRERNENDSPLIALRISADAALLLPSRAILAHYGLYNRLATLRPKLGDAFELKLAGGGRFVLEEPAVATIAGPGFRLVSRGVLSGLMN